MANTITIPFIGIPGPPGAGALTAMTDTASGTVQALTGAYVPVDSRTAQVTVQTPLVPTDGAVFVVADVYGQSAVRPILITAQGIGITIADPSWSGVGSLYGATATIRQQSAVQTWRYSSAAQQWRFA